MNRFPVWITIIITINIAEMLLITQHILIITNPIIIYINAIIPAIPIKIDPGDIATGKPFQAKLLIDNSKLLLLGRRQRGNKSEAGYGKTELLHHDLLSRQDQTGVFLIGVDKPAAQDASACGKK